MAGELRGLTLWRPWQNAFLLQERPKRVENRPWWPKWATAPMRDGIAQAATGERALWLALHAGRQLDTEAVLELRRLFGIDVEPGPPGVIVAVCRLVRVLDVEMLEDTDPDLIQRYHPWISGPYAWEVDQVTALANPVTCKGAQQLWQLPPAVLEQVRTEWARARSKGEGR